MRRTLRNNLTAALVVLELRKRRKVVTSTSLTSSLASNVVVSCHVEGQVRLPLVDFVANATYKLQKKIIIKGTTE